MPAAAGPAATARAGPRGVRSTSRAHRSQATDAPAPRSPAGGSGAADDPAAPAPPAPRSRPGDRSDDPARASATSPSVPALVTGNQIGGGFFKGFPAYPLSSADFVWQILRKSSDDEGTAMARNKVQFQKGL